MKKIENIVILEPTYPVKAKRKIDKKSFYSEKMPTVVNDLVASDDVDFEIRKNKIKIAMEKVQKLVDDNSHHFAFLKLFSRAAKKGISFQKEIYQIDRFSFRLRQRLRELVRLHTTYRRNEELFNLNYTEFSNDIFELKSFANDIKNDISKLENEYYPQLKVTAYNLIDGKTTREIEILDEDIENFVKEFKTFEEAFDYICYHSGELIVNAIYSLIDTLKKNNLNVDFKYFMDSDVVITFTYFEWIDLIRKIKLILRKYKNIVLENDFIENFKKLEVRYGIIVIYNAKMGE